MDGQEGLLKMGMVRRSVLGLLVVLSACVSTPSAVVTDRPAPTWPPAPEQARVAFLRAFSDAKDLGIHKAWWERLGDLLFGADHLRLIRPMAVVEVAGVIYVADPGLRGVHRFDTVAGVHQMWRQADGQALPSPVGLAVGAGGRVFVTDSVLGKVFVMPPGGGGAVEVGLRARLQQPTGIAVEAVSGRLTICDTAAHAVLVFGADGQLERTIGRRGPADGEFNFPTHLWRDERGTLWVSDSMNFRVQSFDAQGAFLAKFGRHGDARGDLARHKGIATDRHGHIYVVDSLQHAFQIYDPAGQLLMAVGAQGREVGEFWLPAGIFISRSDTIFVADAYNQRVQVFRYLGVPS